MQNLRFIEKIFTTFFRANNIKTKKIMTRMFNDKIYENI